ncbi:MAG: glycosyltransferase, partial [Candidatus Binatia bacterium]
GLGAALRDGLGAALARAAADDVVVTMDADDTHAPDLIPAMLAQLDAGADVVIASRFVRGASVLGVPAGRRALSRAASWLLRLRRPTRGVRDYTCGYRAYRVSLLRAATAQYGDQLIAEAGFQCMLALLLRLRAMRARFAEVPLVLHYDRKRGVSKMDVARTVRDSLRLLRGE